MKQVFACYTRSLHLRYKNSMGCSEYEKYMMPWRSRPQIIRTNGSVGLSLTDNVKLLWSYDVYSKSHLVICYVTRWHY